MTKLFCYSPKGKYFASRNSVLGTRNSALWLLLSHAVQGAESPDEVAGINRDDFARGEKRCQRVQGDAVVGIVEDGREHDAVRDVEIGVAGGQAPPLKDDGTGHGKFDDVQRLARLVARAAETEKVVAQGFVIHIFRIVLDHGDDRIWSDEAGEVVDVTVGIVAEDAFAEPDRVRCTEVVGEELFVVGAGHAWIALLDFAEQAFFRGEERAASVDVDGAAFEDDAGAVG